MVRFLDLSTLQSQLENHQTERQEAVVELPFVRSSERGAYKQCPQKWYYAYVDRLVPKGLKFDARDFGTGIHIAMAEWYVKGTKRGRDLLETWEEYCQEYKTSMKKEAAKTGAADWGEAHWTELYELGKAVLTAYLLEYGDDPHWDVIAAENTFQANIANKALDIGTIDLVVRDLNDGTIKVIDHKTANQFPRWEFLNLEDQGGSYSSLARHILLSQGKIGPKDRVSGMEFNYIKKIMPDTRPVNADGKATNKPLKKHYVEALLRQDRETGDLADYADDKGISKAVAEEVMAKEYNRMKIVELDVEAHDRQLVVLGDVSKDQRLESFHREFVGRTRKQQQKQLDRIVDDVTVMEMARSGQIPILKAPGKLCGWCDFFDLCNIDENMDDTEHFKKRAFDVRDPYHDHREGAVNSKLSVKADSGLKRG